MNTLIPDTIICRDLCICNMTLYRWERDPAIEFPPPIYLRGRKYRDSEKYEAWCKRMSATAGVREGGALATRKGGTRGSLAHDVTAPKKRKRKAA